MGKCGGFGGIVGGVSRSLYRYGVVIFSEHFKVKVLGFWGHDEAEIGTGYLSRSVRERKTLDRRCSAPFISLLFAKDIQHKCFYSFSRGGILSTNIFIHSPATGN